MKKLEYEPDSLAAEPGQLDCIKPAHFVVFEEILPGGGTIQQAE
jgi:hypothetical protein